MKVLSETKVNELRNHYKGLVGKQVTLMVTGERVKGTVLEFIESEFSFNLKVEHEPVRWGNDIFTNAEPFARKCDNWGSLNKLEVVE